MGTVSRGTDPKTGILKKPKIVSGVGLKDLFDAGLYAGGELFVVAKNAYDEYYVGGEKFISESNRQKVTTFPAKIDKVTKKIIKPAQETYYVNIGGQRTKITRPR